MPPKGLGGSSLPAWEISLALPKCFRWHLLCQHSVSHLRFGTWGWSASACGAAAVRPARGDSGEREDAGQAQSFPESGTADLMAADWKADVNWQLLSLKRQVRPEVCCVWISVRMIADLPALRIGLLGEEERTSMKERKHPNGDFQRESCLTPLKISRQRISKTCRLLESPQLFLQTAKAEAGMVGTKQRGEKWWTIPEKTFTFYL